MTKLSIDFIEIVIQFNGEDWWNWYLTPIAGNEDARLDEGGGTSEEAAKADAIAACRARVERMRIQLDGLDPIPATPDSHTENLHGSQT